MKCTLQIYNYDDYRRLLRDYYAACKQSAPKTFSYRYWTHRAGFTSSNYLHLVISGARNLSERGARQLAHAMELPHRQKLFFEELVRYCQATDPEQRARAMSALLTFREYRATRHLAKEHFEYFSQWYYPVIRELVALPNFRPDPTWIAAQLAPAITPEQAKRALQVIKQLGLVRTTERGQLVQTEKALTTNREVRSLAIAAFHRHMIELGAQCLRIPAAQREVSGLTMALAPEEFQFIKQKIHTLHEEILTFLQRGATGAPVGVYQLNFQLFPFMREASA